MVDNYRIVNGAYKPNNNWGGPHGLLRLDQPSLAEWCEWWMQPIQDT